MPDLDPPGEVQARSGAEPTDDRVPAGTDGTASAPAPHPTHAAARTARSRRWPLRRRTRREPGAPSRAGRNLPAAIGVGAALLAPGLGGLLFFPVAFVAVVALFAAVGVWEVARALAIRHIHVPLVPTLAATLVLPFAAYFAGTGGLAAATTFAVLALFLWRSLDPAPYPARSIMAGAFTVLWIPFMLSFAMVLMRADGGYRVIITLLLLVVANYTFGYLVGAFFGKHAMAPRISPKKSWEGFGGSIGGAFVVGGLCSVLLLQQPVWLGLALAVAIVAAATAGDLAESMIKRELGVKDMGTILPGHGGVMDRLDSIVFASPVAYLLSATLVPGLL